MNSGLSFAKVKDTALQSLIQEGLRNNRDLRIAYTRIQQAKANLSMAKGAYFPNVSLVGQVTDRQTSTGINGTKVLEYTWKETDKPTVRFCRNSHRIDRYEWDFFEPSIDSFYMILEAAGPGPGSGSYTLTTCNVEKDIAMVRVELELGGHKYTDMLTLVKDGDEWKIVNKAAHRHFA